MFSKGGKGGTATGSRPASGKSLFAALKTSAAASANAGNVILINFKNCEITPRFLPATLLEKWFDSNIINANDSNLS